MSRVLMLQYELTHFGKRHDDLVYLQVARVGILLYDQESATLVLREEAIFPEIILLLNYRVSQG